MRRNRSLAVAPALIGLWLTILAAPGTAVAWTASRGASGLTVVDDGAADNTFQVPHGAGGALVVSDETAAFAGTAPPGCSYDAEFDELSCPLTSVTVLAGAGRDDVVLDIPGRVDGGAGNDLLSAGADAQVLEGGSGDDDLSGGAGDDSLAGGEGADTLLGDDGDDALAGCEVRFGWRLKRRTATRRRLYSRSLAEVILYPGTCPPPDRYVPPSSP